MEINELLTRAVEQVLPNRDGLEKLMKSRKIRLYLGIDPTGSRLHLGHTIALRKLQQFADLGHEAILLIGTGTVLVGDPSQRATGRPKITQEEIDENIKTWKGQAGKIIDFDKVQIKYNGDWITKLNIKDIIELGSHITAVQLFKREMFERRIAAGNTVWYYETLYPILQGYDSVVMDVDLEIGGTDQTFNMLIGRELQQKINNKEKFVLTVPMIVGLDGKQMSKTSGNCVWLDDDPQDMFGKIMSLRDNQIFTYMELLTDIPLDTFHSIEKTVLGKAQDASGVHSNEMSMIDAKKRLAWEIVKLYHGEGEADKAREEFEKVFQKRSGAPTNTPYEITAGEWKAADIHIAAGTAPSMAEAKRLITSGATTIRGPVDLTPRDPNEKVVIKPEDYIEVGKKRFIKVKP